VLYQARIKAAESNPDFANRIGAIQHLPGVTEDCLKKWELGINKPSNDMISLLADAYNAPELCLYYCANECPLGRFSREISAVPSERALLHLRNASDEADDHLKVISIIMDDGELTSDELPMFSNSKEFLIKMRQRIDETLIALEKAEKTGKFS
jgi:hypothetical protein